MAANFLTTSAPYAPARPPARPRPPGEQPQEPPRVRGKSGLPCPFLGDLTNPGIKPVTLLSPALAGRFFTTSATWEVQKPLTV